MRILVESCHELIHITTVLDPSAIGEGAFCILMIDLG